MRQEACVACMHLESARAMASKQCLFAAHQQRQLHHSTNHSALLGSCLPLLVLLSDHVTRLG
jgi:hypothetical protein